MTERRTSGSLLERGADGRWQGRTLAMDRAAERTCVGSLSNDGSLPPEVEALCALLARANQRIAAERRSTSRKLRVVR